MSNPFETEEFKKLHSEWIKKLKESGFKEQEDSQGRLSTWSSGGATQTDHRYLQLSDKSSVAQHEIKKNAVQEYYRLAGFFLHDYKFRNLKEYLIWEIHAEGMPYRLGKVVKFREELLKRANGRLSTVLKAQAKLMTEKQCRSIIERLVQEMYKLYGVKHEPK